MWEARKGYQRCNCSMWKAKRNRRKRNTDKFEENRYQRRKHRRSCSLYEKRSRRKEGYSRLDFTHPEETQKRHTSNRQREFQPILRWTGCIIEGVDRQWRSTERRKDLDRVHPTHRACCSKGKRRKTRMPRAAKYCQEQIRPRRRRSEHKLFGKGTWYKDRTK